MILHYRICFKWQDECMQTVQVCKIDSLYYEYKT